MEPNLSPSELALLIQAVGIALIAVLSFFLGRSIDRVYLSYWWKAWTCLAASLTALFLSFRLESARLLLEPLYFLGEYAFGYLLIAGCRNYATGAVLRPRHLPALIPGLLLAFLLPWIHTDFSGRFIAHSAILAGFFAVAFWRLQQGRPDREGTGLRITSVALLVLALNFLSYVPVLWYSLANRVRLFSIYSSYTSLFDLILETLLGFGTVILVMEGVHREAQEANRELRLARDRMESQARMDPLTESLNRHAFYSLVEDNRLAPQAAPGGCVAVVDIDSLKPINDALGHAAGDAVIRAVSGAIRRRSAPTIWSSAGGGTSFSSSSSGSPRRRPAGVWRDSIPPSPGWPSRAWPSPSASPSPGGSPPSRPPPPWSGPSSEPTTPCTGARRRGARSRCDGGV